MNNTDPQDKTPEEEGRETEDNPSVDQSPIDIPASISADTGSDVAALEAELARMKDHMLRALAESENTRRRAQKDKEDAGKYAISAFARDLLDFADNFRRALESIPADLKSADERMEGVISGIEAMESALLRNFDKHGIQKILPMDQVFDPNFHEVMFETPGTGKPAGTIIQVIEPGYLIKDRLLRPARVGVAKDEGQGSGAPPSGDPGGTVDTEA